MATAGIIRTLVIVIPPEQPSPTDTGVLADLLTLVGPGTNVIIADATWSIISFYAYDGTNWTLNHGVKIELFMTVAGDADIVSSGRLTAFQAKYPGGVGTWNEQMNWG